jgi:hypothetical protein
VVSLRNRNVSVRCAPPSSTLQAVTRGEAASVTSNSRGNATRSSSTGRRWMSNVSAARSGGATFQA